MSQDQPPPRPALAPPFSRPTHPGPLPAIPPAASDSGRAHRPTPYATAPIPAPAATPSPAEPRRAGGADASGPVGRGDADSTDDAAEAAAAAGAADVGEAVGAVGSDASQWSPAASEPAVTPPAEAGAAWPAGQGGRSLRDLPGDHRHPGGVPANPEPEVESVDAVSDYPADPVWSSDAVLGWAADVADWEMINASVSRPAAAGADTSSPAAAGAPADAALEREPSDLARGAAATLERVAREIVRGELVLPSVSWPQSAPAVLAAVLTALLARPAGEDRDGEAREAPASEPLR